MTLSLVIRFDHFLSDVQYPAHVARFPATKSLMMAGLSSTNAKGALGTTSPPPTGGGYAWGPSAPTSSSPRRKTTQSRSKAANQGDEEEEEIDAMIADPSACNTFLTGNEPSISKGPGAVSWVRKVDPQQHSSPSTTRRRQPGQTGQHGLQDSKGASSPMTKQFLRTHDDIDEMIQPASRKKNSLVTRSGKAGTSHRGHLFYESKAQASSGNGKGDRAPVAAQVLGVDEEELANLSRTLYLGPDDPEGIHNYLLPGLYSLSLCDPSR